MNYTEINSQTWDRWVDGGIEWGKPIDHETFLRAKAGDWGVTLAATRFVPREWFPEFKGLKLLGLASGGGQQMPIFAAQGAVCTIMDYSERQLASEKMVAEREEYDIEIVRADMTKPFPFADASFDLIFHPVSNCYIEDVQHVWNECYRVLRPGGILLAGMDNGLNFLFNDFEKLIVENKLPYNPLKDPALLERAMRDDDGVQFSHTMEEQIGGQLKAGFRLTALLEDRDHEGRLAQYAPTYIMTRAIKPE